MIGTPMIRALPGATAACLALAMVACGPGADPTEAEATATVPVGSLDTPTAPPEDTPTQAPDTPLQATETAVPQPTATQAPEPTAADTPTAAPEPTETALETPVPYIYEPDAPPEPRISAEELGPIISDTLGAAFLLQLDPLYETYDSLIGGADRDGCPIMLDYHYPSIHEQFWLGECTASSGVSFTGQSYLYEYESYIDPSGAYLDGFALYLSGGMEAPTGEFIVGAGEALDLVGAGVGYRFYLRALNGTFLVGDSQGYFSGLDGSTVPAMSVTALYSPPVKGRSVVLEGAMGGLSGEIGTVAVSALTLTNAALGSVCPTEPSGSISLRDRDGNWYDVFFDTPVEPDESWDPSLCDGCGDAWFRGSYLGEVCADFSTLLDWGTSPW